MDSNAVTFIRCQNIYAVEWTTTRKEMTDNMLMYLLDIHYFDLTV